MTMLKPPIESKLALEDEGYECSLENFNIPTTLQRTSKIHWQTINSSEIMIGQCVEAKAKQLSYPSKGLQW